MKKKAPSPTTVPTTNEQQNASPTSKKRKRRTVIALPLPKTGGDENKKSAANTNTNNNASNTKWFRIDEGDYLILRGLITHWESSRGIDLTTGRKWRGAREDASQLALRIRRMAKMSRVRKTDDERRAQNLKINGGKDYDDNPHTNPNFNDNQTASDVRDNEYLWEAIGKASELRSLEVEKMAFPSIGPQIGKLQKLERLSLDACHYLSELPEAIGDLTSLSYLYISHSNIQRFPASFGKLENLRELQLFRNHNFRELPPEIGGCTSLTSISIHCSLLRGLPLSMRKLSKLRNIYISTNEGAELQLPLDLFTEGSNLAGSLQKLSVNVTGLTQLPSSLGYANSLQHLDLLRCPIRELPVEVGNLRNLRSLNVEQSGVAALPDSIGNLAKLEELLLQGSRISELPGTIDQRMKALRMVSILDTPLILGLAQRGGGGGAEAIEAFLVRLVQRCPSLVCIADFLQLYENRRDKNGLGGAELRRLGHALGCNRATGRLPRSLSRETSWPHLLARTTPSRAFRWKPRTPQGVPTVSQWRLGSGFSLPETEPHEAVYEILSRPRYRESFLGILAEERKRRPKPTAVASRSLLCGETTMGGGSSSCSNKCFGFRPSSRAPGPRSGFRRRRHKRRPRESGAGEPKRRPMTVAPAVPSHLLCDETMGGGGCSSNQHSTNYHGITLIEEDSDDDEGSGVIVIGGEDSSSSNNDNEIDRDLVDSSSNNNSIVDSISNNNEINRDLVEFGRNNNDIEDSSRSKKNEIEIEIERDVVDFSSSSNNNNNNIEIERDLVAARRQDVCTLM